MPFTNGDNSSPSLEKRDLGRFDLIILIGEFQIPLTLFAKGGKKIWMPFTNGDNPSPSLRKRDLGRFDSVFATKRHKKTRVLIKKISFF